MPDSSGPGRCDTERVHAAFGTVVVVVCAVAIVLALLSLVRRSTTWSEHGKGGLLLDRDLPHSRPAATPVSTSERDSEIRELLQARNARRARRGEPPLDVEAELARLTAPGGRLDPDEAPRSQPPAPAVDPELREEVRQLVLARNHRRARAGRPPLDVEAEVERELRRVTGELG